MSIIKVDHLSFAYPDQPEEVFDDVNFTLDTDWKTGLIGRNGYGKTTFLRLLLGEYEYQGKIYNSRPCMYFPFAVPNKNSETMSLLSSLAPQAEEWEVERETSLLNVSYDALYRPFSTLSPGEQTKCLLAALFLHEDKYLLIDEPTNHLDSEGRKSVSNYLRRKKGFLLVSHDRAFLDACIDHVLTFEKEQILIVKGNYSTYAENRRNREENQKAENRKLEKEISRLKKASKQTQNWSDKVEQSKNGTRNSGLRPDKGYIGHKAAKMSQRAKNMERRSKIAIDEKEGLLNNIEESDSLNFQPHVSSSNLVLSVHNVSLYYEGGKPLFAPVSFSLKQGERLAIEGRNGSGKSSFLKAILQDEKIKHEGEIYLSPRLVLSYVPQDSSFLKESLENFVKENQLNKNLFFTLLIKLGFDPDSFTKEMASYSFGEKKKVLLARSLSQSADIYLWDEPLNYLDIEARVQIENLLVSSSPTMIFIEHDEAFRAKVATEVISLQEA